MLDLDAWVLLAEVVSLRFGDIGVELRAGFHQNTVFQVVILDWGQWPLELRGHVKIGHQLPELVVGLGLGLDASFVRFRVPLYGHEEGHPSMFCGHVGG